MQHGHKYRAACVRWRQRDEDTAKQVHSGQATVVLPPGSKIWHLFSLQKRKFEELNKRRKEGEGGEVGPCWKAALTFESLEPPFIFSLTDLDKKKTFLFLSRIVVILLSVTFMLERKQMLSSDWLCFLQQRLLRLMINMQCLTYSWKGKKVKRASKKIVNLPFKLERHILMKP